MADNDFHIYPDFLTASAADSYTQQLLEQITWRQDKIKLFGREHCIPRQHQWYADAGASYRWSGIEMQPLDWIAPLAELRTELQQRTGHQFNSVLANLYRDGSDSMGWHADDETELGAEPVIASISLGAERDFQIRRRNAGGAGQHGPATNLLLPHGSLLLMSGASQREWQHSLPKRKRISKPRINLTFRQITPSSRITAAA
jgi:alkylated DNA repair dioxygenase AlkB